MATPDGDSYHEASVYAKKLTTEKNLTYVHPYDDPLVIAGQGTIGMEILRQHQHPIGAIFVPIGGGGLIAGIAAIKDIFQDTQSVMEPSGGLALAGIKRYVAREKCAGKTFVAIYCGANMNFDRLRFIAEHAEMGEHHEALLAVTVPESRGSFCKFCELIGPRNVTELNYRIADAKRAHVFVGVQVGGRDEAKKLDAHFGRHGFKTLDRNLS